MRFYTFVKCWLGVINILLFAALIYSLLNVMIADKIAVMFIFVLSLAVSFFLLKYYGNATVKIEKDTDEIRIIKANKKILKMQKNDFLSVKNTAARKIIYFKGDNYFYIIKQYGFKRNKLFDAVDEINGNLIIN